MTVDAAGAEEPEEEGQDEFLADDDTPVAETPAEAKKRGRPKGLSPVESARLSDEIWEEYASGMNAQQVADLHGLTRQAVWARIRKQRSKMGVEDPTEAKALDLGRYEAIIERVWTMTFKDPTPENVRSLAMLMDQRAKLLGLNAPKKLQVAGEMVLTPSPAFLGHLDRIVEERERLGGSLSRPAIEAGDGEEILDAELVDGDPD